MLESRQNDEALAYFYCDRNQFDRQNPASILRSFVRQLSTSRDGKAIQASLTQLYSQKRATGFASGDLKIEESKEMLRHLVEIYPQTTLVLDALDECDRRTRAQLIEVFDTLLAESPKPFKIFISSRPDPDIKDRFESGPNVGITATDNGDDIAKFVGGAIDSEKRWRKKISAELYKDIVETLTNKSQGM